MLDFSLPFPSWCFPFQLTAKCTLIQSTFSLCQCCSHVPHALFVILFSSPFLFFCAFLFWHVNTLFPQKHLLLAVHCILLRCAWSVFVLSVTCLNASEQPWSEKHSITLIEENVEASFSSGFIWNMAHMSSLVTNPLHCLIARLNVVVRCCFLLACYVDGPFKNMCLMKMCEFCDFIVSVKTYYHSSQNDATCFKINSPIIFESQQVV